MSTPTEQKPTPQAETPERGEPLRQIVAGPEPASSHLGARLRSYFLTGLIVVGPVAITIYVGIAGVMLVGALTANLFGRTLVSYSEMMLARMPIVRSVYRTLKQIFETVLSNNGGSFKRVGLIEFPRRGLYAIVFLAGDPPLEVDEKIGNGNPMITVFMPNGPNPTTGFIVFVQASEVIPLDLSVEDAAKLVVSAGLVAPDQQERLRELANRKPKPVHEEEPVV
jgi:uncharacterized membrane protein